MKKKERKREKKKKIIPFRQNLLGSIRPSRFRDEIYMYTHTLTYKNFVYIYLPRTAI